MAQIITEEELLQTAWVKEAEQVLFDEDLQRDMEWFLNTDLPQEFEGQYVAIHDCQILEHGDDPAQLCQVASKKLGIPEKKITIQFVIPNNMAVLYQGV